MFSHSGYTLTASLVALVFAALIWTVGRQRWPRTVVFLLVAAAGGLLASALGLWIHRATGTVVGDIGRLTGVLFGVVFPGLIGLVLAVIVGFHIHHKSVGRGTLLASVWLPFTVSFVPGVVGTVLIAIVGFPALLVGWTFSMLFSSIHI